MTEIKNSPSEISLRRIFDTWWPLAASWLLMGAELPILSAVVARLENPKIHLAAYGGVVFPLALLIEAPIIMLLAASTALSKDMASFRLVRRFMMITAASLTLLHILVAFTPVYYFVVEGLMGAPQEIIEPARVGLMIMTPWTWSIAYRRFNQGVLIRFGHSRTITIGTLIRLGADILVLSIGFLIGSIPGIVVATSAVAFGVVSEAVYSGFVVRPVVRDELAPSAPVVPTISWSSFFKFYIPLSMTSLLFLIAQPLGSAAMSRMPEDINSLAVWPVLGGFLFLLRSMGVAFNEVVVALLDKPRSYANLKRFTYLLAASTTAILLIIAATPISKLWFKDISALSPELIELARKAIWLAVPLPSLTVFQSWYQGSIVSARKTYQITISVIIYLLVSVFVLYFGIISGNITGISVAISALTLGVLAQVFWLWFSSRSIMHQYKINDTEDSALSTVQAGVN